MIGPSAKMDWVKVTQGHRLGKFRYSDVSQGKNTYLLLPSPLLHDSELLKNHRNIEIGKDL